MGLSTDVTLPRGVKPCFPDRCIVCGEKPDSEIKIGQNGSNVFLVFFVALLHVFGWSSVEVPICVGCKGRFRFQRWGREVILWGIVIVAIWLIMPHFSEWSGFTRKVVVGGLVLLAIAPWIVVEVFLPRVFDTTVKGDLVDYEFSDFDYACEFAELNRERVVESDVRSEDEDCC